MKRSIALIILLVVCTFLYATGQKEGEAKGANVLLLGAEAPFTGDNALHGDHFKKALEMAAEEINAKGGIGGKKVAFTYSDDKSDPKEAAMVAQKFATMKDLFCVLGPIQSSCALAGLPIYQKAKLVLMSPSNTNPKVTKMGYTNYFRVIPTDDMAGPFIAEVAIKDFRAKRMSVIFNNDDYGRGTKDILVDSVKTMGGTVLSEDAIMGGVDKEFTSILTKIQSLNPEAIALIVEYIDCSLILRQAYSLGLKALFIGGSSIQHPEVSKLAGPEAAEGLIAVVYYDPYNNDPVSLDYTKRFKNKYGMVPTEMSGFGYDLPYIVKQAYEEHGGTTREKLPAALHKVEYKGVTGTTKFDERGDVIGKKPVVLIMKNGEYVPYLR
jgi:branched-chain amino acid transport system substrate-binding protein